MSDTPTKKCYSRDDEEFRFDEFGDLLDDLDADGFLAPGLTYYEADCRLMAADDAIGPWGIDSILEQLDERLFDEVGECYDNDCSGVPQEAKEELRELLKGWLDKHTSLGCYWLIVGKTREKTITADDIDGTP